MRQPPIATRRWRPAIGRTSPSRSSRPTSCAWFITSRDRRCSHDPFERRRSGLWRFSKRCSANFDDVARTLLGSRGEPDKARPTQAKSALLSVRAALEVRDLLVQVRGRDDAVVKVAEIELLVRRVRVLVGQADAEQDAGKPQLFLEG